jgi:hypothetical protein
MDIKEKAERMECIHFSGQRWGDPVATPDFRQRNEFVFYLFPVSQYFK